MSDILRDLKPGTIFVMHSSAYIKFDDTYIGTDGLNRRANVCLYLDHGFEVHGCSACDCWKSVVDNMYNDVQTNCLVPTDFVHCGRRGGISVKESNGIFYYDAFTLMRYRRIFKYLHKNKQVTDYVLTATTWDTPDEVGCLQCETGDFVGLDLSDGSFTYSTVNACCFVGIDERVLVNPIDHFLTIDSDVLQKMFESVGGDSIENLF